MSKDYLKRDKVEKTEHTWCKIDKGRLEYLDWVFVEQQAAQFDIVGDAGVRDQMMTMCKLLVLARDQTIDKTIEMMTRFKNSSNDASAIVFYDPLANPIKPATFVFFHVGDVTQPLRLVDSIKKTNPGSRIVMCTDADTPVIEGVERHEFVVDRDHIMYHRWKTYLDLDLQEPAVYLDTDMVVRGKIDVDLTLGDKDYVFCKRSFNKDIGFNISQRGLDFSEHQGKSMNDVYPVLGCFIVARNGARWAALLEAYDALDNKFKIWYGDQEVLRDFTGKVGFVEEAHYACLPEFVGKTSPLIVHYKGNRKYAAD